MQEKDTQDLRQPKLDPLASWDMRICRDAPPPGQCDRLGILFEFPEPVGLPDAADALCLWELRNSYARGRIPAVYVHGVMRKPAGGLGAPVDGAADARTMRASGADPWKGVKSSAWLFSWSDGLGDGNGGRCRTALHDWLSALGQCLSDAGGSGHVPSDRLPRPSLRAAAQLGAAPGEGEISLSIATAHRAAQKKVAWAYDKKVKPHLDAVQVLCACPGLAVRLPAPDGTAH